MASFDYFEDSYTPLVVEDGSFPGSGPFTLTTNTVGDGTILVDPLQPTYSCTDVVTLTALAMAGWDFAGWDGDLTGSANPEVLSMTADRSVTATFIQDISPPVISNIQVIESATGATITWTTDEPATSRVDYGLSSGYGSFQEDLGFVLSHSIVLSALTSETTYHFQITSADDGGMTASTSDDIFTTRPIWTGMSDDFNDCGTLSGLWTFVDPLGDASYSVDGQGTPDARLSIVTPGGVEHDLLGVVRAPHVLQQVNDTDFEVEVKFESELTQQYQIQGVLARQDDLNWMRFDFYSDGTGVGVYCGQTTGGVTTRIHQDLLPGNPSAPLWLKVRRVADLWSMDWSVDGAQWISVVSQHQRPLILRGVGLHSANASGNQPASATPAHTTIVDFFLNTQDPFDEEDGAVTGGGPYTLTTSAAPAGFGSVVADPDLTSYTCTDVVSLMAVPVPGKQFVGWAGDLAGTQNPAPLAMVMDRNVVANFTDDVDPPVISNVQVSVGPTTAMVNWETNEPADSLVNYGLDTNYGQSASDGAFVTAHTIPLASLTPSTTYHFVITSCDQGGLCTSTGDLTFTTNGDGSIVSDDFNSFNLRTDLWQMQDLRGKGTVHMVGAGTVDARLEITIPQGEVYHPDVPSSRGVRVLQTAQNEDFEVEVCFESVLDMAYQTVGVSVEQDADNWIRFGFYHTGNAAGSGPPNGDLIVQQVVFNGGTAVDSSELAIFPGGWYGLPLYMRVTRVGDMWTQAWSLDGLNWDSLPSLYAPIVVSAVGPLAANPTTTGCTAVVDYFFNTAAPISPEDFGTPSDTAPPLLYRVEGKAVADGVIEIKWFTDERTNGYVEWGTAAGQYDLGLLNGQALAYDSVVDVPNLLPDTDYHFQVTTNDGKGNPDVNSGDFIVRTGPPGWDGMPDITIWYGQPNAQGEPVMRHGHLGLAQRWINVLGNVSDEGGQVVGLSYTLNDELPQTLWVGEGGFKTGSPRLVEQGDFNVELDYNLLLAGLNEVLLTAVDDDGNAVSQRVWVDYDPDGRWPKTTTVDWSTVTDLQDAAQVVDGRWEVTTDPILGSVLSNSFNGVAGYGYDRLVAIGESIGQAELGPIDSDDWVDYEFEFPVRVIDFNPAGFEPESQSHLVGMIMRWPGHSDGGQQQPRDNFFPFGAIFSYRWFNFLGNEYWEAFTTNFNPRISWDAMQWQVVPGQYYIFKGRCETQLDGSTLYRVKSWDMGSPEPSWDPANVMEMIVPFSNDPLIYSDRGSLLLVVHELWANIGNIKVTEL